MESDDYEPVHDWIGPDFATWLGENHSGAEIASYLAARQGMEHVEPDETVEE